MIQNCCVTIIFTICFILKIGVDTAYFFTFWSVKEKRKLSEKEKLYSLGSRSSTHNKNPFIASQLLSLKQMIVHTHHNKQLCLRPAGRPGEGINYTTTNTVCSLINLGRQSQTHLGGEMPHLCLY